ncbi:MAG: helix-turn-helix transcriptional regulator [Candidatus Cloacimonetes bacterium]|nr:helix-turn-helix transcriptional regulator [Candidatus Cloacimonadota bacterium]
MNKVDLVVLGFLMREPMHGYQIAEFFEKRGLEFWIKIKMPSVYKALTRLEESGHLVGKVEVDECNRARKVYSITDSGKIYFQELLDEIFFTEKFVSPFDFWNAFRFIEGNVTRDYFIEMIRHRQMLMMQHQQEMEEKRKCHEQSSDDAPPPFYLRMLFHNMHKIKEHELKLLDEILSAALLPENAQVFKKMGD